MLKTVKEQVLVAFKEIMDLSQLSSGGGGVEDVVARILSKHTKLSIISGEEFKRNFNEYYSIMGDQKGLYERVYDFSEFRDKEL